MNGLFCAIKAQRKQDHPMFPVDTFDSLMIDKIRGWDTFQPSQYRRLVAAQARRIMPEFMLRDILAMPVHYGQVITPALLVTDRNYASS